MLPSPPIGYKQILPQRRLPFPGVALFSSLSKVLSRPISLYSCQPREKKNCFQISCLENKNFFPLQLLNL